MSAPIWHARPRAGCHRGHHAEARQQLGCAGWASKGTACCTSRIPCGRAKHATRRTAGPGRGTGTLPPCPPTRASRRLAAAGKGAPFRHSDPAPTAPPGAGAPDRTAVGLARLAPRPAVTLGAPGLPVPDQNTGTTCYGPSAQGGWGGRACVGLVGVRVCGGGGGGRLSLTRAPNLATPIGAFGPNLRKGAMAPGRCCCCRGGDCTCCRSSPCWRLNLFGAPTPLVTCHLSHRPLAPRFATRTLHPTI